MRIIVTKPGQSLTALTSAAGTGRDTVSIERLTVLNPHLDLHRLEPGTVVLLPDAASDQGESVTGAVFDSLADDVRRGLTSASERVRNGLAEAEASRKEVTSALKTAAFRKALDGNSELTAQVAQVDARFKADQSQAKQAMESLSALEEMVSAELERLGNLLR